MGQISVNYPVPGDPNSSEDQKVLSALQTIVNAVNTLDNANIAPAAGIEGSKLANTSIAAAKLAANAVEEAKILNGAVTTDKLNDLAVTAAKLASNAVTNAKIDDQAVDTAEIKDGAVTNAKIAASTTGTVTNSSGVTGTVTARKYADGMVLIQGGFSKSTGNWTAGTNIATVPTDYRPTETISSIRPCTVNGSTFGLVYVTIATNGTVTVFPGSPFSADVSSVAVGGITYHAA